MSGLVTGEAVALGIQPAKLPSRALAMVLDIVVYWGVYIILSFGLLAATASLDGAAVAAVYVATLLLVLIGLPIAVETLTRGRSLGKLACGLRVLRDDGGPIRFRHAFVRGAVGLVEIQMTLGVVACIASLVSARGRRVGDVFAGTLVVRERIPVQRAQLMPPPPPWVAAQMAGVDLSAVPEGLWLAVRQYLARMGQLDPQVGWAMAQRLAEDVTACTGAPVPAGMPPAAFLAAVVAERQARDARKAFGAAAQHHHAQPPMRSHPPQAQPQPWGVAGPPVPASAPAPVAVSPPAPVADSVPAPPPGAPEPAPSTGFAPPA